VRIGNATTIDVILSHALHTATLPHVHPPAPPHGPLKALQCSTHTLRVLLVYAYLSPHLGAGLDLGLPRGELGGLGRVGDEAATGAGAARLV
jgi:hypothetical protein